MQLGGFFLHILFISADMQDIYSKQTSVHCQIIISTDDDTA